MQKTLILMQKKKTKNKERRKKAEEALHCPRPVGMVLTMIWDGNLWEGGLKKKKERTKFAAKKCEIKKKNRTSLKINPWL